MVTETESTDDTGGAAATAPNAETELKLAVRPEDLERLRAAPLLKQRGAGRAVTKTLESVYFDTDDFDLMRRLVTFRVRRSGERFVQTLKTAPTSAGGLTRGEWEWAVAGPEPDLSVIAEAEALEQLGTVGAGDLRPVFTSHVRRTIRVIDGGEAAIELAFDTGEIRLPGGGTVPLSELELELKRGDPAALFELARLLASVAPLRVESRSKAARGFALASGTLDDPVKAEKLALDPEDSVETALCRVMRACLAHAAANEASVLKGTDPEGVHQMRVALRRLRSAFSLFRPFLPADQHDGLVADVKWLGSTLGPARDWDVFLGDLLAPVIDAMDAAGGHGRPVVGDLRQLEEAAKARRDRAYDAVREAVLSERYTGFQLRFAAWLEGRGWREQRVDERSVRLFEPVRGLADELLAKRHRKARKSGKGFAGLTVDERHQVRIALKKLRYASEFFRALYEEKAARRYIQQVSAFQDALGHLNDVATATRLMHDLHEDGGRPAAGEARAAGIVIGWHARGVTEGEERLLALWRDFADTKPFW
ncbi:CHAD domain-containing protein [Azospirillum sp. RWY-5-1]|uniref:CHAD domain-containing protein n=1 Tax=Azospirillum oleiclasticum TaxID=2735135 RepID=A0ABX2TG12_9PROT|nr:CYTH and CHAD domain-containing protein [Azospirillum oleiclasticum]NYZ14763.1 CHAD domain-containing protein [Azospirillum oleiclasticum]NYZ22251.1 CHAD domain-containing protein [Azospirillum oleiclasticum]